MRSSFKLIGLIATLVAPALSLAQSYPSAADPRSNLKPGRFDAGVAASNMRLVSFSPKPAQFDTVRGLTFINSDVAFGNNHYAYQGNFAGFTVWDVANPTKPVVASVVECITSQGDPSIIGNLLFVSAEGAGNRNDCGKGGVQDPKDHMAGVRIFDVSNPRAPKLIKNVQTCKGSHTHTVVPSPTNPRIIYLYVSGQQAARPETELAGCNNGTDPADPSNSLFQLDIIKVPLDHPEQAAVIPGAPHLHWPRCRSGVRHAVRTGRHAPPAACSASRRSAGRSTSGRAASHRPTQLPRRDGLPGDAPARRCVLEPFDHGRYLEPRTSGPSLCADRHQQLPGSPYRWVQQRRQQDHHDG